MDPLLRAAGGLLALVASLVGLPVALMPLYRPVFAEFDAAAAAAQPLNAQVLVAAGMIGGWVLWVWLLVTVIADTAAAVSGRRRLVLPAPLHTAATTLAAVAGSLLASGATQTAAPAPPGAVLTAPPDSTRPPQVTDPPVFALASATPARLADVDTVEDGSRQPTYLVQRGDTLWRLAGDSLGSPHRWPEIYQLNAARYDQHGRMRGGHHIEPGWVLTLPEAATAPGKPPTDLTDPADPADPGDPSEQPGPGGSAEPSQSEPGQPSGTLDPEQVQEYGDTAPPAGSTPSAQPGMPTSDAVRVSRPPSGAGDTGHPGGSAGVSTPGGSWVPLSLALAVLAAAGLVRAHRQRRYTPRPPSPRWHLDRPDLTAMPPIVTAVRRALRRSATTSPGEPPAAPHPSRPSTTVPTQHPGLHKTTPQTVNPSTTEPRSTDQPDTTIPTEPPAETSAETSADGDTDDGRPLATDGAETGTDLVVSQTGSEAVDHAVGGGLGLTGAGATSAARGLLVTALTAPAGGHGGEVSQAGQHDLPGIGGHVVIPAATAATLFDGPVPPVLGLTVTDGPDGGLGAALDLLEARALHLARLLQEHDVEDLRGVQAADPLEEDTEPLLLITAAPGDADRPRLAAVLAQGHRLGLSGVLLGPWPHGQTIAVDTGGTIRPASVASPVASPPPTGGGRGPSIGTAPSSGRVAVLSPADAIAVLTLLAEANTDQPAGQPADVSADAPTAGAGPAEPAASTGVRKQDTNRAVGTAGLPGTDPAAVPAAALDPQVGTPGGSPAVPGDGTGTAGTTSADTGPRVRVRVLGPPEITEADTSRGALRAKSLELLVYLAVHEQAVHYEAILDDLLPDAPASRAVHRLHTYVSDLRNNLRRTGGGTVTYLTRPGQRYELNRSVLDVDLWRMQQALHDAETAGSDAERITAWRRAVDTYQGDLADGTDYEWIEPYREAARRQYLDATLALTDALITHEPGEALALVDAALQHSPYTEALYQAAMRANAALGRVDAIRTVRRTLTRRLADIDAEPTDASLALADHLVAGLPKPRRRPSARPASHTTEAA